MKKIITMLTSVLLTGYAGFTQLKVGLPAGAPAASAILDASNTGGATAKGFLAPQIALTALNAAAPVTAPAAGLWVYNTATAGVAPNDVTPGFYYWNGTQWVRVITAASSTTTGNIYSTDGTLAGARIVSTGGFNTNWNGGGTFTLGNGATTTAGSSKFSIMNDGGGNGIVDDMEISSYGVATSPGFFFKSSGGTVAAPTNIANGINLGVITWSGRVNGAATNLSSLQSNYVGNGTTNLSNMVFATSGAEMMRIESNGNIGVGIAVPTAKLDVNGTARIRTVNQVAATTAITPLFVDAAGNIVKSSATTTFGSTSAASSAVINSGASGVLITTSTDVSIYKAVVSVADVCGDVAVAEYYITAISANSYFAINGAGGIIASGNLTKSPTFNQVSRSVISTTWNGKVGCAIGDNSTSLNYTLTISYASPVFRLTVTNNGNIAKSYRVTLTRIN